MDFLKTKLYQRTRSGYDKLYLEYNEKKKNGRRCNGGGGLGSDNDGDCVMARVGGDSSKDKSSEKSSEVLRGSDGGRDEVNAVARRTRQALRGKKKSGIVAKSGKNLRQVEVIDVSESSDDGLQNHMNSEVEEASESEKSEKIPQRGQSRNKGENVSQNSLIDESDDDCRRESHGDGVEWSKSYGNNQSKLGVKVVSGIGNSMKGRKTSRSKISQQNSANAAADDDYAYSYLGDGCNLSKSFVKGGFGDGFHKDTNNSSLSSGGFLVGESDDDVDGVRYLGDDATCLDDYDPSHSSRVESNEVKVSPVEMDSVQADADAKLQALKSSEEEDDDPQKQVSPEEDGSVWRDIEPIENNAMDDDLADRFLTALHGKHTSDKGHLKEMDDCEQHCFNSKPVCGPGKKKEKVNFIEPVVSLKRCGSSNEMSKPIERGSKRRRTDTDFSNGLRRNNNRGGEDTYWEVVHEKVTHETGKGITGNKTKGTEIVTEKGTQKAGKSTSKKYNQFGNKINLMEILTDAIRKGGDGDVLLKKNVDIPIEENPIEKPQVNQVQSYKFKFEDEEDIKPGKSESEMEVDGLFDEMNMCLQLSEIGSLGTSGVNCGDADFVVEGLDQATCCRRGKHQLTINDEFGIVCRYCSYVEMEIRDILPPLCKDGRGGHGRHDHDKTDNMKVSDLKLADCCQERRHDTKGSEYEKGTVWDLVPGVKETMYPHQRDGFEFIWNKIAGGTYIAKLEKRLPTGGSGCIISHAPGTGKSRLTIVFLQAFLKMYPTSKPLIIAPRSMLLTWEEEFKKWNVDFPFYNLNNNECSGQEHKIAASILKKFGSNKCPRQLRLLKLYSWKETPSVLGITYRLFESLAGEEGKRKRADAEDEQMKEFLLKVPTLLVLDEGHTPRNDQSHMWKTLVNVKTKRSIILSGTPFQNNFDELYNTLCLVNPLLSFGISSLNSVEFSKKRGWKHNSTKGQWDSITSSIRNSDCKLQELRAMIDPFVHVHKGTILQERLPGLRDALVVLKPTKTQHTLLGRMSGSRPTLENDHLMSLVSVHPSLFPQSSNHEGFHKMLKVFKNDPRAGVKTNFLMELIKLSGAHNEKVLVFSQYLKPLEFIMQLLKTNFRWVEGRECLYMDGQQEEKQRQASINTLNDPKSEAKVLLASLRACSEGINLVGASRVVLLDVHWNPSVERQAISRAYRLGQKKLVHVYHLVTGSMEGEKYIRQVEKSHLSELVFSSKNKDNSNPKISSTVSKDKILEEMVQHDKLQYMFEKVIYQPKEADLIETFS